MSPIFTKATGDVSPSPSPHPPRLPPLLAAIVIAALVVTAIEVVKAAGSWERVNGAD
jgi:hypothetical protein